MSNDKLNATPSIEYFQRLKQLQNMGFGNDDAADALHDAEFDVELAVQYLTEGNPFRTGGVRIVSPFEPPIETPSRPPVPLFDGLTGGFSADNPVLLLQARFSHCC
ncbi:hypothetical protein ACHAQH_000050 [Verticillium albo-atrum]